MCGTQQLPRGRRGKGGGLACKGSRKRATGRGLWKVSPVVPRCFPVRRAQVRSRVGHKEVDGRKVRYLVKTGELLD